MKKIILLSLFAIIFSMTTCFAQVKEFKDDFTGGKDYISTFIVESLETDKVSFIKYTDGKNAYYELISVFGPEHFGTKYSNSPIGLKIDDYPVSYIQPIEVTSGETSRILVRIEGNNEVFNRIANAKRVALKIERTGSIPLQHVLTDIELGDWKQIIAK